MENFQKKNCANASCSKEFIPQGPRQIYCKPECRPEVISNNKKEKKPVVIIRRKPRAIPRTEHPAIEKLNAKIKILEEQKNQINFRIEAFKTAIEVILE